MNMMKLLSCYGLINLIFGRWITLKDNDVKIVNNDSITDIVKVIETHRENAYRKVNEELVTMYYEIGKYLSEKVASEKWGSKVINNIANEINNKYPTLKGFDNRGLYRMMQFYDTYKVNEIVAPLVRQISWKINHPDFVQTLYAKSSILSWSHYLVLVVWDK